MCRYLRLVIAVCAGLSALLLNTPPASASTSTSYVTANLAGANSTYGINRTLRIANTSTVKFTVAVGNPAGVGVQEVCRHYQGLWDSADELVSTWGGGRSMQWLWVTTGKRVGSCDQANAVFSVGNSAVPYYAALPFDGDEQRYIVCIRASGFVNLTTCSTHLSTKSSSYRQQQANYARVYFDFIAQASSSYGSWLGGDLNDTPGSAAANEFYSFGHSEADRFLNRATEGGRKIDFGFGFQLTVSQPGANLAGRGSTSDHDLIWAPYTWG